MNKINFNTNLNDITSYRTSTKNLLQLKLRDGNTSNSPIKIRYTDINSNKHLNSKPMLKSAKNSVENINFNHNIENLNFISRNNARSLSFNNIVTKFGNKNQLSSSLLNKINYGLNSNKRLQDVNNHNILEQEEKQNLGFTTMKSINKSRSNKKLNFNTEINFYNLNNLNSNKNIQSSYSNMQSKIKKSFNNKDLLYIENSERNFSNGIAEKDFREKVNSNRNIKNTYCNKKKDTENTPSRNSGLKIPKNFLKFNSDLFSDEHNFNNNLNKISLHNYKTNNSNLKLFLFKNIL